MSSHVLMRNDQRNHQQTAITLIDLSCESVKKRFDQKPNLRIKEKQTFPIACYWSVLVLPECNQVDTINNAMPGHSFTA